MAVLGTDEVWETEERPATDSLPKCSGILTSDISALSDAVKSRHVWISVWSLLLPGQISIN